MDVDYVGKRGGGGGGALWSLLKGKAQKGKKRESDCKARRGPPREKLGVPSGTQPPVNDRKRKGKRKVETSRERYPAAPGK